MNDDRFLDHQLRRLPARQPAEAPAGIEAEVWQRIRAAERSAEALWLSSRALAAGLALAAALGILFPLAAGDGSSHTAGFDLGVFSQTAPALPSTRLGTFHR